MKFRWSLMMSQDNFCHRDPALTGETISISQKVKDCFGLSLPTAGRLPRNDNTEQVNDS
jgi:hypothetical protein